MSVIVRGKVDLRTNRILGIFVRQPGECKLGYIFPGVWLVEFSGPASVIHFLLPLRFPFMDSLNR